MLAALAGGLGALARYELAGAIHRRTVDERPWGTATVNLLGAAAFGVLIGLEVEGSLSTDAVRVAGTGFFGGFTTFSTWMVESLTLAREGGGSGLRAAGVNVLGMLAFGLAATGLGLAIGRT